MLQNTDEDNRIIVPKTIDATTGYPVHVDSIECECLDCLELLDLHGHFQPDDYVDEPGDEPRDRESILGPLYR